MTILETSISSSWFILVVLLIRLLKFSFFSKKNQVFMWYMVSLSLLLPWRFSSDYSVYTLIQKIYISIEDSTSLVGEYALENTIRNNEQSDFFSVMWLIGCMIVSAYFIYSHIRYRRIYSMALLVNDISIVNWKQDIKLKRKVKILVLDRITSPLTYGLIEPVIILPKIAFKLNKKQLEYILNHEKVHIKQFHIVLKWIIAICVCIHWFNPIVWIAYFLINEDIELACDEQVLWEMKEQNNSDYALTLIQLEEIRNGILPLCSGFSRKVSEERIYAIMRNKKISKSSQVCSVLLITGILVVFGTTASSDVKAKEQINMVELNMWNNEINSDIPTLEFRQDTQTGLYSVIAKDKNKNIVYEDKNIVFDGNKTIEEIYEKYLINGE